MKRLIGLNSGKWPNVEPHLLEFDGNLSLVSLLIALNTDAPAGEILARLDKANKPWLNNMDSPLCSPET